MTHISQLIAQAARAGFDSYGSFNEGNLQHEILTYTNGKHSGEVIDIYYYFDTGEVKSIEYSNQFFMPTEPIFTFK